MSLNVIPDNCFLHSQQESFYVTAALSEKSYFLLKVTLAWQPLQLPILNFIPACQDTAAPDTISLLSDWPPPPDN